ncbi:MAG: peptidoglycan-binding domain-containing protein [Planctomycetota bacterium]
MAGPPGNSGSSDFSSRLAQAMGKARSGQSQDQAASQASGSPSTQPASDDFSDRLSQAMARARGDEPAQQPTAPTEEAQSASEQQPVESTGPVGTGEHVVRSGECVSSIAKDTGHFWETIWNDSGNSELRAAREDPNVLLAEDRVHVPDLRRKEEPGQTEMRHRFRRLGEPAMLRMRILEEDPESFAPEEQPEDTEQQTEIEEPTERQRPPRKDKPRSNLRYVLIIDGTQLEGVTDEDGVLEQPIPGNARRGRLILDPGELGQTEIQLQLGHLSPRTELPGLKERLANLTFDCGDRGEEETPRFEAAVRGFQEKYGLEITGQADQATRNKLEELHGS